MRVEFGVLGPVTAWDDDGGALDLKGPRHRAVLARLLLARGRVVPVAHLVEDLWPEPPAGAVGAVRTFVSALRRAIEPHRPPRSPSHLLVTDGPGYALRPASDCVDAWRFEAALTWDASRTPADEVSHLDEALNWWRGPPYADFVGGEWTRSERSRLFELRLLAVERRAEALIRAGRADRAVPDLDAHVTEHLWRENAWRLLALALYRTGRQGDALAVLRRARTQLREQLGIDPGPELARMETHVLQRSSDLDATWAPVERSELVWVSAAAAYDQASRHAASARLESTVSLMRSLAVTGGEGLEQARSHFASAVQAAEELGDAQLTARVVGGYAVPAVWTRSDEAASTAEFLASARRTVEALPPQTSDAARARMLAAIAVESRGADLAHDVPRARQARAAALSAERLARGLDDPALLAFALNGVFMQSFHRAGLADTRDAVGAELVALSSRHDLVTYQILGHLIRLQARSALGDFPVADTHARAAETLARQHEIPLVAVLTRWYRVVRLTTATSWSQVAVEAAFRDAALHLKGAGMPGVEQGILALALLGVRLQLGLEPPLGVDWGPYRQWITPLLLLDQGRTREASDAMHEVPPPPPDLLQEALWCVVAHAATKLDDRRMMLRAYDALSPAAHEIAGAGSGLLSFGPVEVHLHRLEAALGRVPPVTTQAAPGGRG